MEIIVGKNAGFCFGVNNAVTKTKEYLKENNNLDCLGKLVHNNQVTSSLEEMGLRTIEDIKDAHNKVIIRAHGVSKNVYDYAKNNNIELIDLTCPKVLLTHKLINDYPGFYLIFLGKHNHPETIGSVSLSPAYSIIENIKDVNDVIKLIKQKKIENILVIAQTTFSLDLFNEITKKLQTQLNGNLVIKNTICPSTKIRQEETEQIAKQVDGMIIIGGKNSSNTKALYYIANKYCPTILIEDALELDLNQVKSWHRVGIMAGTSTPQESIDLVVNNLKRR